jgi:hypothetical protein
MASDEIHTATPEGSGAHATSMREAYERVLPEIQALKPEELAQVNIDIPGTVTKVLGALPRIRSMRDQITTHLPTFNIRRFDALEDYLLAMGQAHSDTSAVDTVPEGLPALNERVTKRRDLFLSIGRTLVLWELLKPEQIAPFRGVTGYRLVAFELTGLSRVFLKQWDLVEERSGLRRPELDDADQLGLRMLSAVGEREEGPATSAEAVQVRQRAFTLFWNAYDDATRAVDHLRWHEGDADTIIPSLYPGRPRKAKVTPDAPATEPGTPAGHTAPATPAAPAAPAPPAATPAAPTPPHPPMGPSTPGGPGGSPFIS